MAGADRYFATERFLEICRNNISDIRFDADALMLIVWLRDGRRMVREFSEDTKYGRELLDLFGLVFQLCELDIDTEHG